MKWIVLPAALALAAGCGGDGGTGPEPGDGALLVIAPGSMLLVPGTSQTVTVYQVDASGRRTAVDATIESSSPSIVSVSGGEASGNAVGSAMLTAKVGALSAVALAIVARPAPGALLVADSQVVGTPEPVDAGAQYGPGWQYRVHVRGAEPSVGQIMLASGGALVAGRVVSVAPESGGRLVTLELRPLGELFQELSVSGSLPLTAPAAAQSQSQSSATLRPSHVRAATANQVETEFELGSFECKASAGVAVSNFTLVSGPLTVTPALALEFAATTSGLQRLAVTGSIAAAQEFRPRFNGVLTGDVDCHAILFAIPFPVGGPLGWFIAGKLPIGAGFTLKAEVTTALMGVDLDLHGQATAMIGIDCTIVCHPVGDFTTSTDGTTLKPVLPDLGASFHARLDGTAYIYTEFGIGNPIIESFYIDLIEAKGGVTQSFDLATREYQAAEPQYASSFELTPTFSVGTTARIGEAAEVLGFELPPLAYEAEFDPIAHSPVGTLVITPATVRAADGTTLGEQATFTVTMDSVNYLGAYAIEGVEIRWKKTGTNGAITLDPGRPGCTDLAAAADQRVFTCSTDFLESQAGAHTFHAFVKTRIFGVPVVVPLEVATDGVDVLGAGGGAISIQGGYVQNHARISSPALSQLCYSHVEMDVSATIPAYQPPTQSCSTGSPASTASGQVGLTTSAGSGAHLVISGTGSANAHHEQNKEEARGRSSISFRVSDGPANYHLTGQLSAGPGANGSETLGVSFAGLYRANDSGSRTPILELQAQSNSSVPLDAIGTLPPGNYDFYITAEAYGSTAGSYNFSLDLSR